MSRALDGERQEGPARRISVRITNYQDVALKEQARTWKITESEIVREALERYIAQIRINRP